MTGDLEADRAEAQAMSVALSHWIEHQLEAGANAALLAAALLGLGTDMMGRAQGPLVTRDALRQLAADIVTTPENPGEVH
jgi:hypothetical protein